MRELPHGRNSLGASRLHIDDTTRPGAFEFVAVTAIIAVAVAAVGATGGSDSQSQAAR
ncbi:MAG: hypothetical protein NVS3B20_19290 [Polyangiales bacterium]